MATWSIGGKTYNITEAQHEALVGIEEDFIQAVDAEFERLRRTDPRYDGRHIGNAPDPFKQFAIDYYERVCAVLGRPAGITRI